VAAAGSGLGLWFMPPALNDSGDASAGQISAAASAGAGAGAGAGAVEERHERRRRFLFGGEPAVPFLPCCNSPPPPLSRDPLLFFSAGVWNLGNSFRKAARFCIIFPTKSTFLKAAATFFRFVCWRAFFF
jgi:hypothetical protein